MFITINPLHPDSVHQQIINQIKTKIAKGWYKAGDTIPTVRQLAGDLVLNPKTIKKAYDALEREGIIYAQQGRGTFVAPKRVVLILEERQRIVREMIERMIVEGIHMGLSKEEISELFHDMLDQFNPGDQEPDTSRDVSQPPL